MSDTDTDTDTDKAGRVLNLRVAGSGRLGAVLRQAGFELIEADGAAEAIRNIRERQPHLVLLEAPGPDARVFELWSEVRRDPVAARLPVLQVTALDGEATAPAAAPAPNADIVLPSAVQPHELVAAARTLLRLRAAEQNLDEMAHRLRGPLNAILGWVQLMRTGRLSQEQHAQAIETLDRNVHLQSAMIDEVLKVTREARPEMRTAAASAGAGDAQAMGAGVLKSVRVLVADQDSAASERLAHALMAVGADVMTARDMTETETISRRWRPAVLVVAVSGTGADAAALLQRLRTNGRPGAAPLRAIAVCEAGADALAAGFDAQVSGRDGPQALLSLVAELARRS